MTSSDLQQKRTQFPLFFFQVNAEMVCLKMEILEKCCQISLEIKKSTFFFGDSI